ncbi:uncharacterized protein CLAFUR5_09855 [Fulvia fulva]|uniref:Uncharacterized protein n=1 Tax=Passalora fulva TaxID=5499 RepID=A0A9Q8US68_PASFU|nr:uncharacterized protein CLAFUR5_09855 [Fulvia fulva]UJO20457.1 hypothetical protein CLAFUR5_09855 [Fulvia fulva]
MASPSTPTSGSKSPSNSAPNKIWSLLKMGNTPSKTHTDLLTKAHELVARVRSQYPLSYFPGSIEHSKRLDTLEEILKEKKPPIDVVQVMCEQLAGLLDSEDASETYEIWEAKCPEYREAKVREDSENFGVLLKRQREKAGLKTGGS